MAGGLVYQYENEHARLIIDEDPVGRVLSIQVMDQDTSMGHDNWVEVPIHEIDRLVAALVEVKGLYRWNSGGR